MKEIYDLLKRLCELEPERFHLRYGDWNTDGYATVIITLANRHNLEIMSYDDLEGEFYWILDGTAQPLLFGALREAIEARGLRIELHYAPVTGKWLVFSDAYEGSHSDLVFALLKAYVAALESEVNE